MRRIHQTIAAVARFAADDSGATAIEYAIIGTLISITIIGAVTAIGQNLVTNFYDRVVDSFPH
jgi:pilus assembly protein Flp/PilA